MFFVANRAAGALAALLIAAAGAYWLGQPLASECPREPRAASQAVAVDAGSLLAQVAQP